MSRTDEQSTQRFETFVIDGKEYVLDTAESPSFPVQDGRLFWSARRGWIYRKTCGVHRNEEAASFVSEEWAADMLCNAGAYNLPQFRSMDPEMQDRILKRLGERL